MKRVLYFLFLIILLSCSKSGYRGTRLKDVNGQQQNNYSSKKASKDTVYVISSVDKTEEKTYTGEELFSRYESAVFMIYTSDGLNMYQGSGFFISPNGIAVSNYHVFKGTTIGAEEIHLSNGEIYKVKEVYANSNEDDYIIFKVDVGENKTNYLPMSSRKPRVGEKICTIGSPRGLENTFSSGEISQLRGKNYIQINAPIDHGSSGGALINSYGEVIGITSGGYDDSGANLNYAISISVISSLFE